MVIASKIILFVSIAVIFMSATNAVAFGSSPPSPPLEVKWDVSKKDSVITQDFRVSGLLDIGAAFHIIFKITDGDNPERRENCGNFWVITAKSSLQKNPLIPIIL